MANKISAALATHNEEENIQDCINSLKLFADEIIVADGDSSDRTAEIALNAGAKVIKTSNKAMFHINKNLAIENCKFSWVFLIDADERVSHNLAEEIKSKVKSHPEENGFWINRRNWFLGDFLTKGGAYPDSVIRLFKNGQGRLPEISVHEQVKIEGKVGKLKNGILHLADPNFERYLKRAIRYTDRTSDDLSKLNLPNSIFTFTHYTVAKPIYTFLKIYLRHKGFKDGFRGFIWALFSALHTFLAYTKLRTNIEK